MTDWMARASCREHEDPELWFSDDPAEAERKEAARRDAEREREQRRARERERYHRLRAGHLAWLAGDRSGATVRLHRTFLSSFPRNARREAS